ncbi:MAG: thioredoxin TrxC [Deltaproteobacteria bacterium]|nr:thioredoxin TrxC [Deltaproteobacteria bacterium]
MNNPGSLIVRCPSCGTKNRIPGTKLHDRPKCGKCHSLLPAPAPGSKPIDVNDASFSDEILNHAGVVLVDFWAPWCGPCKMMSPVLEQLAAQWAGRVKIAKLNVDENQITASRYGIQSIPSLLLFKNGKHINTLVGALPKSDIERQLQAIL